MDVERNGERGETKGVGRGQGKMERREGEYLSISYMIVVNNDRH